MPVEERDGLDITIQDKAGQEQNTLDIYRAFSRAAPGDTRVEYKYPHTVANVTKQMGAIGLDRWARGIMPEISAGKVFPLQDLTRHLVEGGVSPNQQDALSLVDKMAGIQLSCSDGSYLTLVDRTQKSNAEYGDKRGPREYKLSISFNPDL